MLQYFKKGKKRKGVMTAVLIDGLNTVRFGYSLCKTSQDKFSKKFGKEIAIQRALCGRALSIPHSMELAFIKFYNRCVLYYKEQNIDKNYVIKKGKNN